MKDLISPAIVEASRAIIRAVQEARHDVFVKCCKLICPQCAEGHLPEFRADPEPGAWHGNVECLATAIWLEKVKVYPPNG